MEKRKETRGCVVESQYSGFPGYRKREREKGRGRERNKGNRGCCLRKKKRSDRKKDAERAATVVAVFRITIERRNSPFVSLETVHGDGNTPSPPWLNVF